MNRCGVWMAVLLMAGAAVAAAQDLETSYQNLQNAVAKKDAEAVKKLAAETVPLRARRLPSPARTPTRTPPSSASTTCTPLRLTANMRSTLLR